MKQFSRYYDCEFALLTKRNGFKYEFHEGDEEYDDPYMRHLNLGKMADAYVTNYIWHVMMEKLIGPKDLLKDYYAYITR